MARSSLRSLSVIVAAALLCLIPSLVVASSGCTPNSQTLYFYASNPLPHLSSSDPFFGLIPTCTPLGSLTITSSGMNLHLTFSSAQGYIVLPDFRYHVDTAASINASLPWQASTIADGQGKKATTINLITKSTT